MYLFNSYAMCYMTWWCRDFVSSDPKVLRVAMSSFYDMLSVVMRTFREFEDEVKE